MSIDYDRIQGLTDKHTPGPWVRHPDQPRALCNLDTKFLVHHEIVKNRGMEPSAEDVANTELIALAPDMARELIRLRDGSSQLLAKKRAAVERLYSTDPVTAAILEAMCDELENLLNGDPE